MRKSLIFFVVSWIALFLAQSARAEWQVGAAKADITGTIYGRQRMGYVKDSQLSLGVHTRLYARAFVFKESDRVFAYVITDLGMVFKSVRQEVLRRLRAKHGEIFNDANLMISATHTHSGPAGLSSHGIFNLFYGASPRDFEIVVDGIVAAIEKAHARLEPAEIRYGEGDLTGFSVNRSLKAYQLNPEAQREAPVDTAMKLLAMRSASGAEIAALNWFPVHGTSMSNRNQLISGDNKGVAALFFERTRSNDFVAGFGNANEGDVSPLPNHWPDSPTISDLAATEIVARAQAEKARELFATADETLEPVLETALVWVNLASEAMSPEERLCQPAIGYSMFAGAEDGPGDLGNFQEGMLQGQPLALDLKSRLITLLLKTFFLQWPNSTSQACHFPKPIIGDFRDSLRPLAPTYVPFQLVRLGRVVLIGAPAELTTTSGRRITHAVLGPLKNLGVDRAVIVGLANDYIGYVATAEEYQSQQYEGASTYFGPRSQSTMSAIFSSLARSLAEGTPLVPTEESLLEVDQEIATSFAQVNKSQLKSESALFYQEPGQWKGLGQTVQKPRAVYSAGQTVMMSVLTASPNLVTPTQPFATLERKVEDQWLPVYRDGDPEIQVSWLNPNELPAEVPDSLFAPSPRKLRWWLEIVRWPVTAQIAKGTYRLRVHDAWNQSWTATSESFLVK